MLVSKGEWVSQYIMSLFTHGTFYMYADILSEDLNFKWHEIKADLTKCVVTHYFLVLINNC